MKTKKTNIHSIKWIIFATTSLPLLLACLIITLFSSRTLKQGIRSQAFNDLQSIATGAMAITEATAPGDFHLKGEDLYKGDYNLTQEMEMLEDYAAENDVEITFCFDNIRRATTIIGNDGNKITGTTASPVVTEAVLDGGQNYTSANADVNGQRFYCFYMPLENSDGSIVGMVFAGKPTQEMQKFISSKITIIVLIAAIVFLAGILFANFVTKRRILKPVWSLLEVAKGLAQGNINQKLKKTSKDEFGELTDAFQELIDNTARQAHAAEQMAGGDLTLSFQPASQNDVMGNAIEKMIDDNSRTLSVISLATNNIMDCVRQVAETSSSLSDGAADQAGALEEISASVESIAEIARNNARDADTVNQRIGTTKKDVILGNQQMQTMITAMNAISQASVNVSNIIKSIDDIAFQTNIIALNASVEAARAGEHGRGFAVVAEEIRGLAAKSAASAKSSADLIEDSLQKTKDGAKIAADTAASLEKILKSIEEIAQLTDHIAISSSDQSSSVDQMNQGISQVSQVVQNNSTTSQECADTTNKLEDLIVHLTEAVNQYKLAN